MDFLAARSFADPVLVNGSNTDLHNISAVPPPPGMVSNFNDMSVPLFPWYLAVAVFGLATGTIFTLLRIYAKIFVLKDFRLEDVSLLLAWAGMCVWYALSFILPANGRHYWNVTMADAILYAQGLNVLLCLFAPVSLLAKYAIFAQLKRLFTQERNLIWWLVETSLWTNVVLYMASMFLGIFQCWPRSRIGNPLVEGYCMPFGVLVIPPTIVILLSDIWMAALPVLIVWKLQIALQRKYAIVAAFAMGMLSLAAVVLELYFSVRLSGSRDLSYGVYPVLIFAGLQMSSLVVAAALPTMPQLWMRWRNVALQESEASPLGRLPSKRDRSREAQGAGKQYNKDVDIERAASPASFDHTQPETLPYEILTTTEVRVTSYRMGQRGLE